MLTRIKSLPLSEFCHPGVSAMLIEPEESLAQEFHLTVVRGNDTMCWLVMTPQEEGRLKLNNRYINDDMEAMIMDEKLLQCAENWARREGYKQLIIEASSHSILMYERKGFIQQGEPFTERGMLHYKMKKDL